MDKKDLLGITHFSDYLKPAQVVHDLKAKDKVQALSKRYGELDGEMSYLYATAFAAVTCIKGPP